MTDGDRDFLLDQINARLQLDEPLTPDDIISSRCGVRPLVVEGAVRALETKDWTSLSRKHAMEVDKSKKFITIFGGKLTDCVNVGNEVARAVGRLGLKLERDRKSWYGEPPKATKTEFFRQARLMHLDKLRQRASFETPRRGCGGATGCGRSRCWRPSEMTRRWRTTSSRGLSTSGWSCTTRPRRR